MLQRLKLDGDLKIGQHKTINCAVQLEIEILEYDEWADQTIPIDYSNFIDGVRILGELSFDIPPLYYNDKHPVRKSVMADLILRDDDVTTRINILFLEKSGESVLLKGRIHRYFWQFYAIGKPAWDKIGIFPSNYRGKNMNRFYSCVDFRGYWPVGVASVIVAHDEREALSLLKKQLKDLGIPIEGDGKFKLKEIDIQTKGAVILIDGN